MTMFHLLEPLFVFPDANVRARLGPEDVQRTVSPLFNFKLCIIICSQEHSEFSCDCCFQIIPFNGLREAQNLLNDNQFFMHRPRRVQNLISVTQSFESIPTPGVEVRHISLFIQASYLRV